MATYNTHANATVFNGFNGTVDITLSHGYSDDPQTQNTWTDIAANTAGSAWQVGYNTGLGRVGQDYWYVTVNVKDGPQAGTTWQSDRCTFTLHDADKDSTLLFAVLLSNSAKAVFGAVSFASTMREDLKKQKATAAEHAGTKNRSSIGNEG